jgi:hypothetical protein
MRMRKGAANKEVRIMKLYEFRMIKETMAVLSKKMQETDSLLESQEYALSMDLLLNYIMQSYEKDLEKKEQLEQLLETKKAS